MVKNHKAPQRALALSSSSDLANLFRASFSRFAFPSPFSCIHVSKKGRGKAGGGRRSNIDSVFPFIFLQRERNFTVYLFIYTRVHFNSFIFISGENLTCELVLKLDENYSIIFVNVGSNVKVLRNKKWRRYIHRYYLSKLQEKRQKRLGEISFFELYITCVLHIVSKTWKDKICTRGVNN